MAQAQENSPSDHFASGRYPASFNRRILKLTQDPSRGRRDAPTHEPVLSELIEGFSCGHFQVGAHVDRCQDSRPRGNGISST